ncbi:hypothetical protein [Gimesia maris]|uniref:hypothetical protein n=1 Tax=Gimesia maris TaxID=122 RepID=UPI0030D79609|tara:strand:+ start:49981 stop:50643 length:663 start_codon:yes stop_codon:yes gene_type:complete
MGESTKSLCALLMIVSGIAGALAWTADRPDTITWGFRIGGPIAAIFALGVILKLQFRADLEHDYLRALTGAYFNRNDFCFAFVVTPYDGIAFMDAYFQTQRDKPCIGRIALRPARGFFFSRAKIDAITFEVGASVRYPDGKGHRVRFHDGIFLRSNTNFGNSFGTALTVAGTATGSIALSQPATATIDLPVGVAEDLPDNIAPEIKILWQLGEPPLENVS